MVTLPGNDASSECLGWPQVLTGEVTAPPPWGDHDSIRISEKRDTAASSWVEFLSLHGRCADVPHEARGGHLGPGALRPPRASLCLESYLLQEFLRSAGQTRHECFLS